jgi:hypothetical protein
MCARSCMPRTRTVSGLLAARHCRRRQRGGAPCARNGTRCADGGTECWLAGKQVCSVHGLAVHESEGGEPRRRSRGDLAPGQPGVEGPPRRGEGIPYPRMRICTHVRAHSRARTRHGYGCRTCSRRSTAQRPTRRAQLPPARSCRRSRRQASGVTVRTRLPPSGLCLIRTFRRPTRCFRTAVSGITHCTYCGHRNSYGCPRLVS